MDAEAYLEDAIKKLEELHERYSGFEIDSMSMLRLVNFVHKEMCCHLTRTKRYLLDIREVDSDKTVRELMMRKRCI
ncbi:MAG: hypothetical protein J6L70_00295 [Alphaproteobacteria bacterium]|nr:hypothetical protein [Alphaproteobacteria bacterium]